MIGNILNTLGTRILNAIASLAIAILISNYLGAGGKGEQGLIIATISIIIYSSRDHWPFLTGLSCTPLSHLRITNSILHLAYHLYFRNFLFTENGSSCTGEICY